MNEGTPISSDSCQILLTSAVSQVNEYLPLYHDRLTQFELPKLEVILALLSIGLLGSTDDYNYSLGCRLLHKLRQEVLLQVQVSPVKIENVWIVESL